YFGSVGFGNLATILSNEGDSLGDCIQLRSDDGASESGCMTNYCKFHFLYCQHDRHVS
ncbi:hypothetical protein Godav_022310, partial [Gossypium davidsonii]|nr:hypothetical protein [Gossypium davidsonii]